MALVFESLLMLTRTLCTVSDIETLNKTRNNTHTDKVTQVYSSD